MTASGTQEFGFNAGGQRGTVWDGSGNLISAQYGEVAYYLAADGHVRFEHDDWTGTERMRTTDTGTVDASFLSLPFGDGLQAVQGTDTDPYHFAGLDQDAQNIEHAAFRELSSVQGRWLRPDPYDGSYNFFDPQSMNRYAYAENTPMSAIDPSGLQQIGSGTQTGCTNNGDGTADCDLPPDDGDPSGGDPGGDDPSGGGFGLAPGGSIGLGNGGISVPSGLSFGSYGTPPQSNVSCSTVLPNGKTVGQYINQGRAQMQASVNAGGSYSGELITTFASIAREYGQIDFKNGAAGTSVLYSRAQLGRAGNFAYYAIGSGFLSPTMLDVGASGYSHAAALLGKKPFSSLTGPLGIDASANSVRAAALATPGCPG